jgi:hypothetical protein
LLSRSALVPVLEVRAIGRLERALGPRHVGEARADVEQLVEHVEDRGVGLQLTSVCVYESASIAALTAVRS